MKIYLTNLGKYNEGYLVGEWVHLPISSEDLKEVLTRIGINQEYEEYFITDYECDIFKINEFDSISYLNEIAEKLEELSDFDISIVKYFVDFESLEINEAIENFEEGNYCYYFDVEDESDLGYRVAENWDIPEYLSSYIDYEAIGRDYLCSGWNIYDDIAICTY